MAGVIRAPIVARYEGALTAVRRLGSCWLRHEEGSVPTSSRIFSDGQLDSLLREFGDDFKSKIKIELQSLFQQYMGQPSGVVATRSTQDQGKGILGVPPLGFPPKKALVVPTMTHLAYMGASS
ncbi:hypothetical protein J1N35_000577 [Gossypium stocksii]|uniref:Uncharacterized protein n=1 Tax=Gossypium stocksii TaxID=47602 RepID=A0A9D4AL64_9ROSI|nr:hypothetical protein J1N35_000577 [Gossypium stocksii]